MSSSNRQSKTGNRKSPVVVVGSGPPLVLVPGIQGRWEWMRPAVRALAGRFRVITFSLTPDVPPFDRQVEQVVEGMDRAGAVRAVVCGVSYGGLVALRCAATHPSRVSALVLVSTPGPYWTPDDRSTRYVSKPWLSVPAFAVGARSRLWHEVSAAHHGSGGRWLKLGRYLCSVGTHPPWPPHMARRVEALAGRDFASDARAVSAPTLVLTGEAELDRVVPVAGTLEYAGLIPGARSRILEGTGHIGLVTRSEEFAAAIAKFVFDTAP